MNSVSPGIPFHRSFDRMLMRDHRGFKLGKLTYLTILLLISTSLGWLLKTLEHLTTKNK